VTAIQCAQWIGGQTRGGKPLTCAPPVCGGVGCASGEDGRYRLPVEPLRRMLVPTEPRPISAHPPMIIDMSNGFHFRPSRQILVVMEIQAW
jgi:hypothetical protein